MANEVYSPFPKFENPIFKLAMDQKRMLCKESINRLKSGEFTSLNALYECVKHLSEEEINDIIEYWNNNDLNLLSIIYEKSLKTKDIDEIMKADRSYYLYTCSKNYGGMGKR